MANAKKFYQSLTLQEKRFIDDKTMSTTMSVKNWIAFLTRASAYDAHRDKMAGKSGWLIALGVVLTIVSTVVYFEFEILWVIAFPTVFGCVTAWLILQRTTLKSRDLNNYLRLFFMPFLKMMEDFAGPEAKLSAGVDFRDPLKSNTAITSTVRGRSMKLYQPKYIAGKITLKDGTFLETVIADDIKVFNYRNANGKSKSKTKTTHHYFIRLSLPKQTYRSRGLKLLPGMTFEETNEALIFKLKGKAKEMNYDILKFTTFQTGIKHIYMQVENLTAPPAVESSGATKNDPSKSTSEVREGIASDSVSSITTAYWASTYFEDYDYRNTDFRDDVPLVIDEENSLNVFES